MLAALFFLPAASATEFRATATFSCSEVAVWGPSDVTSETFVGLWLPMGSGGFSWRLEAGSFVANWTRESFVETAQPTDPEKPHLKRRVGTSSGEEAVGQATATSTRDGNGSQMITFGPTGLSMRAEVHESVASQATQDDHWGTSDPHPALSVTLSVPPGTVETRVNGSTTRIIGNFSVYVSGSNVTVKNGTHEQTFRAGNWTEAIAPNAPGEPSRARYRHFQALRFDARNATLDVSAPDRPSVWLANELRLDGEFRAEFLDVDGRARYDDREPVPLAGRATFDGDLAVRLWNQSASAPVLSVVVDAAPDVLGFPVDKPGRDGGWSVARPDYRLSPPVGFLFLVSAGLIAFLALAFAKRGRLPTLSDAEAHLLARRPERARKAAGRLMERDSQDDDALFLYASTFLVRGEFRQLLAQVEPRALAFDPRRRRALAYLLALAAHGAGDGPRLARWASEAARDPLLEVQLAVRGVWDAGSRLGTSPSDPRLAAYS